MSHPLGRDLQNLYCQNPKKRQAIKNDINLAPTTLYDTMIYNDLDYFFW